MTDILLPQLGTGITNGTIIVWHKKEGDHVQLGDALCDVQIADNTATVESTASGILAKIVAGANDKICVNSLLATVTDKASGSVEQSANTLSEDTTAQSVPHSMTRMTIARRLSESKQQIPHFYVKGACRIDALLDLRKTMNQGGGVKVSVNDLIVRAVALALGEVPDANVSWGEKAMLRHQKVDVAVAVATSRGLVTPIIRDVESKQPAAIASEIQALAERARAGRLKPNEYQGGTVTVSNLGMFGVEEFSAIINPPQSMIFAIGAGQERVVVNAGKAEVGTMMSATVSVDHRAVDGAVAAQVFAAFKRLIEAPERLMEL